MFGLKSDIQVRKDAISKGNSLTFQQAYDLAKTEESTRAQMHVITQGDQDAGVHSVRSKKKSATPQDSKRPSISRKTQLNNHSKHPGPCTSKPKFKFRYSGCFKCGNKHNMDTTCPAIHAKNANTAAKQGTSRKCA